jgi:hypothetical protein
VRVVVCMVLAGKNAGKMPALPVATDRLALKRKE